MVCSTAILSTSLALSLLRHSSPPTQSFVLSPFSLTTALSVIHDGADGDTQKKLSDLLLNGCSDYNVTELYSSIASEIHTEGQVVTLAAANRFYLDETISLKHDYQRHVKDNYNVTVRHINLKDKKEAAKKMSKFVEKATKGSIKNIVTADQIHDNSLAFLINAVRFMGKWEKQFEHSFTKSRMFSGLAGMREMDFMQATGHYRVNRDETFGTVLLVPYMKYGFNFFFVMPNESSNIKQMRGELTGEKLVQIIQNSTSEYAHITIPKFKVESELDGMEVLTKMGVTHLSDLSKISSKPFSVGQIKHSATIKTSEEGTEATAATVVQFIATSSGNFNNLSYVVIDRPFLFGILKNDQILFIGQYMVCSTAILTSTLALSLLRNSSPPNESFVLFPFSLNTALSIINDGASGDTQKQLTDFLLKGCDTSDVTEYYSSLAHSLPSFNASRISFKSANRFFVDKTISLKIDYQKHIQDKYKVKVKNIDLTRKEETAHEMNEFIEESTNELIKGSIDSDGISDNAKGILINAVYFMGKWKDQFRKRDTSNRSFKGSKGEIEIDFMQQSDTFSANLNNEFGTLLILPYQNENFKFFYLMPNESSTLEKLRNELTGAKLLTLLKESRSEYLQIIVPKFKIESSLNGMAVLSKMGVDNLRNLDKISSTSLEVDTIQHDAVIEMNESGTEAAGATTVHFGWLCGVWIPEKVRTILIDRPFLFGIIRNDDILFLGQYA